MFRFTLSEPATALLKLDEKQAYLDGWGFLAIPTAQKLPKAPDFRPRPVTAGAIDGADLERVAHFVQQFLKSFRPGDCWSLTYATTCSKPRVGEFGGGAVFVTAAEIKWDNAHDFVDRSKRQFLSNSQSEPYDEEPC